MKKIFGCLILSFLAVSVANAATPPVRKHFPRYSRYWHTSTTLMTGEVMIVGGTASYYDPFDSVESYNLTTREWSEKARLNIGRSAHQAVTLLDGTVLVIGGMIYDDTTEDLRATTSVEAYDPLANKWTQKAPLLIGRRNENGNVAAIGLKDNRILILGGEDDSQRTPLKEVELYDPGTNTVKLAAPLNGGYAYSIATRLQDDSVLVVGWSGSGMAAEIYDPIANTWTAVVAPAENRIYFSGTLLPSGKLLIACGLDTGTQTPLTSTELFDPSTRTWSKTGPVNEGRSFHTATLTPDGNVLIVGGVDRTYITLKTAELYTPATGAWTSVSSMQRGSSRHTSSMSGGKLFVFGGGDQNSSHLPHFEVLDVATRSWDYSTSPGIPRYGHTATLLANGDVLISGGIAAGPLSTDVTQAVEIYHPGTDSFSVLPPLLSPRYEHAAIRLNDGKVLIIGGLLKSGTNLDATDSVELYDPVAKTVSPRTPMHEKRHWFTATLLQDGRVLVIGGAMDSGRKSPTSSVEIYDPLVDVWYHGTPMGTARFQHSATLMPDGKVLVIGGNLGPSRKCTNLVELYDPDNYSSTSLDPLPYCRDRHSAHLMPDGGVIVLGGQGMDDQGNYKDLKSVLAYDPSQNTWTQKTPFSENRTESTNFVKSGSKILAVGGDGELDRKKLNGSKVEVYDYTLNQWTQQSHLYDKRNFSSATLLGNGKIFVHGGTKFDFGFLGFYEMLTP